ncbi:MAG: hypothetical protein ACPGPF_06090 [Pontibacterium sp.]
MTDLVKAVLKRASYLAIEKGRLKLEPASGDTVASKAWLADHGDELLREILTVTNTSGLVYQGFSTGYYGKHVQAGLTLRFVDLLTLEDAYAVFNVSLTRERSTKFGKKGSRLPDKHFIPPKAGSFVSFWLKCGVPLPRSLSCFHDCMGKLKPIVLQAEKASTGKLINKTVLPLNISHHDLLKTCLAPDNELISTQQQPDNSLIKPPDSKSVSGVAYTRVEGNLGGCSVDHGLSFTGERVQVSHNVKAKEIEKQDVEEWLAEYENYAG